MAVLDCSKYLPCLARRP